MSQPNILTEWGSELVYRSGDITEQDLAQPVRDFRFVVHRPGPGEQLSPINHHVSQFLLLDGETAVRINMHMTNLETGRGLFRVEKQNCPTYDRRISKHTFPQVRGQEAASVRMVIDTLLKHDLHSYDFAGDGVGAAYWHITALKLYENYRWVAPGSSAVLLQQLRFKLFRSGGLRSSFFGPGTWNWIGTCIYARDVWPEIYEELSRKLGESQRLERELKSLHKCSRHRLEEATRQICHLQGHEYVPSDCDNLHRTREKVSETCEKLELDTKLCENICNEANPFSEGVASETESKYGKHQDATKVGRGFRNKVS